MELKAKAALAAAARTLAESYALVYHNTTSYIPAHWMTEDVESTPPVLEKIWIPLSRTDKRLLGNINANILFATDSELSSFDFMLRQYSQEISATSTGLFVRTKEGLRVLTKDGLLVESDGTFMPNFLRPVLNVKKKDKEEVFKIISGWLNSDTEAHSLLHHLATALSPHWSAVKYVLLLGDGRNGKSVLLTMLSSLFGTENVSNITRQQIADQSPVCVELNNKLINVVFDGRMDYVKDSALEKTLIAGEPGYIRMLYESGTTRVQTNALFIEALNKEPKTRDKSSALQKRLVRFWFPNVYARDVAFENYMKSEKILGAFLSLLIDHYVQQDEAVEKLTPTEGSVALQVDQMWINEPAFQYLEHLIAKDVGYKDKLLGSFIEDLVGSFMAWRMNEGFSEYSSADTVTMFKDCFDFEWKTVREGPKTTRKRKITRIKPEVELLITEIMKGVPDGKATEVQDDKE